jgi:hypothetical protein
MFFSTFPCGHHATKIIQYIKGRHGDLHFRETDLFLTKKKKLCSYDFTVLYQNPIEHVPKYIYTSWFKYDRD